MSTVGMACVSHWFELRAGMAIGTTLAGGGLTRWCSFSLFFFFVAHRIFSCGFQMDDENPGFRHWHIVFSRLYRGPYKIT